MNSTFFKFVLRADFSQVGAQFGLLSGQLVHFLVDVSREAVSEGIATVNQDGPSGQTFVCLRLHSLDLPALKSINKSLLQHQNLKRSA